MKKMNRILIADDSIDLLEIFKITLSEEGYVVRTVSNKREFYGALKTYTPDLIILDVFLNDVDGREICKEVKRNTKTKKIPVMMCSANPYAIAGYKMYGANDAIEKPFSIPVLLEKIDTLLGGGSHYKQAS